MKNLIFLIILVSCVTNYAEIELERKFLKENPDANLNQLIQRFGEIDDSIIRDEYSIYIWDSFLGNEVRFLQPPIEPLDSTFVGSRQIKVLYDKKTQKIIEYKYWDYCDSNDYKIRNEMLQKSLPR